MYPNWMTGFPEFATHVVRAHAACVNGPTSHRGENVHVGIFDTIGSVDPEMKADVTIEHERSNPRATDAGPHGYRVLAMAEAFASDATYSVYQVFKDRETSDYGALVDMVEQAIDDGVDLVNMSLGNKDSPAIADCPVARATEPLLDHGIPVVAASGNYERDTEAVRPAVASPAAMEAAIAVSGVVARCPEPEYHTHDVSTEGPYYVSNQPGTGVYCGFNGCRNGTPCEDRRAMSSWRDNPRPRNGSPDVLAPPHFPTVDEGGFLLASGTSHSAPIVTGVLASIFGELRAQGRPVPTPERARAAVHEGGTALEHLADPVLNGLETRRLLLE